MARGKSTFTPSAGSCASCCFRFLTSSFSFCISEVTSSTASISSISISSIDIFANKHNEYKEFSTTEQRQVQLNNELDNNDKFTQITTI